MGDIEVKVGQVWADNDKRSAGRTVTVVALEEAYHPFKHYRYTVAVVEDRGGRRTRIRTDRMRPTSTGYRLVRDA